MQQPKAKIFIFEELEVWQRAIEYADLMIDVAENLQSPRNHFRLIEQLESAATSVAMNIAEGKGRYSKKEFVHFLYIARGSLFETITLLKLFERRGWIEEVQAQLLYEKAGEIGKMLNNLIKAVKNSC
jgi:four helix bundle protein